MGRYIDLSGERYARLKALEVAGQAVDNGNYLWLCECDCGEYTIVRSQKLRSGEIRSCGCLRDETTAARMVVHGLSYTVEHGAWRNMIFKALKNQCEIWEPWLVFGQFLYDMGRKPDPEMVLKRIDKEKGYTPQNLAWDYKKAAPGRTNRGLRNGSPGAGV